MPSVTILGKQCHVLLIDGNELVAQLITNDHQGEYIDHFIDSGVSYQIPKGHVYYDEDVLRLLSREYFEERWFEVYSKNFLRQFDTRPYREATEADAAIVKALLDVHTDGRELTQDLRARFPELGEIGLSLRRRHTGGIIFDSPIFAEDICECVVGQQPMKEFDCGYDEMIRRLDIRDFFLNVPSYRLIDDDDGSSGGNMIPTIMGNSKPQLIPRLQLNSNDTFSQPQDEYQPGF